VCPGPAAVLEAALIPPGLSLQLQGERWRKRSHGSLAALQLLHGFRRAKSAFFKVIPNLPALKYGISPTLFYILNLASIFLCSPLWQTNF